jgi:hypothetical protein
MFAGLDPRIYSPWHVVSFALCINIVRLIDLALLNCYLLACRRGQMVEFLRANKDTLLQACWPKLSPLQQQSITAALA